VELDGALILRFLGVLEDSFRDDLGAQLYCPICGDAYVHFGTPDLRTSDEYTAWKGRGDALYLPMSCESGHAWMLRIGFHKGKSFLDIIYGD